MRWLSGQRSFDCCKNPLSFTCLPFYTRLWETLGGLCSSPLVSSFLSLLYFSLPNYFSASAPQVLGFKYVYHCVQPYYSYYCPCNLHLRMSSTWNHVILLSFNLWNYIHCQAWARADFLYWKSSFQTVIWENISLFLELYIQNCQSINVHFSVWSTSYSCFSTPSG